MASLKPKIRHDNDAAKAFDPGLVAAGASGDTLDASQRQANYAIVQNGNAGTVTVTVKRTGDADVVVSIPTGAFRVIPVVGANTITCSPATSVNLALLAL